MRPKIIHRNIREVFTNGKLEETDININEKKNVGLADNVALKTEDVKDVEHHLNTVNEDSLKIGLQIHKSKFVTNIDTTDNIQMDGTEIEKVTNYKYLGQTMAMENRTKQELAIRIKAGWSV